MENYDISRRNNPRILTFLWITLIATLILILGLARQQIVVKETFLDMERRQTIRRILLPSPRGDIYDRNGELLVGNRPQYSATVILDDLRPEFRKEYSKLINDARKNINELSEGSEKILPNYNELKWQARTNIIQKYLANINEITGRKNSIKKKKIIRHFNEQLLLPLPIAENLTHYEFAQLIEKLPVNSPITINTNSSRFYPHKSFAAHTLGYVQNITPDIKKFPRDGIKNYTYKTKLGKTGIEKSFDTLLSGNNGYEIWQVDPLGFQNKRLQLDPPQQGQSLITSLDIDLQKAAEIALGNRIGAAIALDVKTGEVLALASHPSYDLNETSPHILQKTFDKIESSGAWLNRAVQLSYPPGSTFKLITAIAALRNNIIDENTKINCPGYYKVGNRIFHCHSRNGHGVVDLQKAISLSCNTFFYNIGLKLGIEKIYDEATRFKLDQKTNIEIPFETKRLVVPNKKWKKLKIGESWTPGDTVNTSIGQGFLLVTPLQMATMIASIGRDELHTTPTLRAALNGKANNIFQKAPKIGLSKAQRDLLISGMKEVVSSNGTGKLAYVKDFPIAGKTGTADFRAHNKQVNLAWFIGFAPAENPKIAVSVMIQGKKESDSFHGGSTAGPVAKDIFKAYKNKYIDF